MTKKVYLCGPIQDAKDGGVRWRDKITPKLEELGWIVLDPCKSEANLTDGTVNAAKEMMTGWLSAGHRELFRDHMRKVRQQDMDMVMESDLLIVHLDSTQRPGGTYREMGRALDQKIPIYVVCHDPIKEWNHWWLSEVWDYGKLFDSWTSLMEMIEKDFGKRKR